LKQKLTVDEVDCMVGRKLSFVPSPNIKQLSVPKIEPMHDFVQPKSFSKLGTAVSTGHILSKVNIYKSTMISETNIFQYLILILFLLYAVHEA
jgi:hypothetical protein